jgi:putative transposase
MPSQLVRYQKCGVFHFITFSCYQRQPKLGTARERTVFEQELERVRQRYRFVVAGYVVMPEHVHLLLSEPCRSSLAVVVQVLKQCTSHRLKSGGAEAFWQRRYYDFNVWSEIKRIEKLRYIHRNPVARGLVEKPEDWAWSSFRHHATGLPGNIEIESQWTAARRAHQLPEDLRLNASGNQGGERPPTLRYAKDGAPSFEVKR